MKLNRLVLLAGVLLGCAPRQVEVRTAPERPSGLSLQVMNDLTQPVNVYLTIGGTDTFLRQVPAKTQQNVPVPEVASGTTVNLKAVTVDGTHTYTRANVVLSGQYSFPIP